MIRVGNVVHKDGRVYLRILFGKESYVDLHPNDAERLKRLVNWFVPYRYGDTTFSFEDVEATHGYVDGEFV